MIKRFMFAVSLAVLAVLVLGSPVMAAADCAKDMKAVDGAAKKVKLSKDAAAKVKNLQKKARAEIKAKKKECEATLAEAKKILKLK